jgi:hypothetical protein
MADELAVLDRRIAEAMVALRRARALSQHSANSETRWNEEMAERTLNGLLDRRSRHQIGERAKAMAVAAVGPGDER